MTELEKHFMDVKKECSNAIHTYKKLKEQFKGPYKSLTEKAYNMGRSTAWVNQKVKAYNKAENDICGTCDIDYFAEYEKVENAEFFKAINIMIYATINNPRLPIESDKYLMELFGTTKLIVDKYIAHVLLKKSKSAYYELLPEEIKKEISVEEILG